MPSTSFSVELITSWIFPFKSSQGFSWMGAYCLNLLPSCPPFAKNLRSLIARRHLRHGWQHMMNPHPKRKTKQRKRTRVTTLTKNSLKFTRLGAIPIRSLEQSSISTWSLKIGSPRTTRLLYVCLMFSVSFLLWSDKRRSFIFRAIFTPPKPMKICFSSNFSPLCLLLAVHYTKSDLVLTVQLATLERPFTKTALMTTQGSPIQDAERVNIAGTVSSLSCSSSSTWSYSPMSVTCGIFPNPQSSGMATQEILLNPLCVNLAVISPIVNVLFAPRQIQIVLSVALTQEKISLRKEFQEVESNRMEMAPSMSPFKLDEMEVAEMKLVDQRCRWSFSPQMKSPNMTSQKKLFNLLESLVVNDTVFDRQNQPRITSDDPSMIASSFSLSAYLLLCSLLPTFFFTAFTLSTRVSLRREHFCPLPSTVQSGPLIQLSGAVRSAASATCFPSFTKGITQEMSFQQHAYLNSASWFREDSFLQEIGSRVAAPALIGTRRSLNQRQLQCRHVSRERTNRTALKDRHMINYYNTPIRTKPYPYSTLPSLIIWETYKLLMHHGCAHSMLNCRVTRNLSAVSLWTRLHSSTQGTQYQSN